MIDILRSWLLSWRKGAAKKRPSSLERVQEEARVEAHIANQERTQVLELIADLDRRNLEGQISGSLWIKTREDNEQIRDYWNGRIAQCAHTLGLSIEEAYAL